MKTTTSTGLKRNIAILNLAILPLGSLTTSTSVTASIGRNSFFTIHGYTGANNIVEMTGSGVYQKGLSDSTGFFEFREVILPQKIKDICISGQDTSLRPSPPTCITLPPVDNRHRKIGPILLAPTLSISKNNILPGEANFISGEAVPTSTVRVQIFPHYTSSPAFPKPAFAASTPVFTIETNANALGQYSMQLPSSHANSYSIHTQSLYNKNQTPPSFSVSYSLPNYSLTILQLYPWLLPILLLQIFFISLLLFFKKKQKKVNWLMLYPHSLLRLPKSLWLKS